MSSRRASGVPQTPIHNDDALERSLRRQQSSTRGRISLSDVARRVQDSPLRGPPNRGNIHSAGRGGATNTQVVPGDFEEWMKLVRMKKVRANNAFTIQLIDAFHSMVQGEVLSLDGQNVTFQEATHTLGGCLTVYKNRIARVKDDTSKLLIGVSENKPSAQDRDNGEASDDEDGEDGDDDDDDEGAKSRKKKKTKKAIGLDAYLSPASKLEIDTNELATSIDPLLRKMSADFDKRGAGALLQYSLKVDKQGRLLLDAEAQEVDEQRAELPSKSGTQNRLPQIVEEDEEEEEEEEDMKPQVQSQLQSKPEEGQPLVSEQNEVDLYLAHFNVNFFANVDYSQREALPMVDGIASAVSNPVEGTDMLIRDMQAWASTNPSDSSTYAANAAAVPGLQDEGSDQEEVPVFSEGLGLDLHFDGSGAGEMNFDDPMQDPQEEDEDATDLSLNSIVSSRMPVSGNWMDAEYLKKLDTLSSNWAGPSFWKIRRLHAKDSEENEGAGTAASAAAAAAAAKSKSRQKMASAANIIDFFQEEEIDINNLFATSSRSTLLSSKQYDLTDKHLLPVDMHVTTKQLLSLYLRPDTGTAPAFRTWAQRGGGGDPDSTFDHHGFSMDMSGLDIGVGGDNNDAEDYFYGGWNNSPTTGEPRPVTASEMFSQASQANYGGAQNSQLNFARVAKRVDVRRLKDNVWKAIQTPTSSERPPPSSSSEAGETEEAGASSDSPAPQTEEKTLIQVIQETQPLYSEQQRSDLSPAMYFISLLHLSNEKGLSLHNTETLNDIRITCGTKS